MPSTSTAALLLPHSQVAQVLQLYPAPYVHEYAGAAPATRLIKFYRDNTGYQLVPRRWDWMKTWLGMERLGDNHKLDSHRIIKKIPTIILKTTVCPDSKKCFQIRVFFTLCQFTKPFTKFSAFLREWY